MIVVDTREQRQFRFGPAWVTRKGTLHTGDYSIEGLTGEVAIERKSLNDLVQCCSVGRRRFKTELQRLAIFPCRAVVIEAEMRDVIEGRYYGGILPQSVVGSICSWMTRFGVPFVFAGEFAADVCLRFLITYWDRRQREIRQSAVDIPGHVSACQARRPVPA